MVYSGPWGFLQSSTCFTILSNYHYFARFTWCNILFLCTMYYIVLELKQKTPEFFYFFFIFFFLVETSCNSLQGEEFFGDLFWPQDLQHIFVKATTDENLGEHVNNWLANPCVTCHSCNQGNVPACSQGRCMLDVVLQLSWTPKYCQVKQPPPHPLKFGDQYVIKGEKSFRSCQRCKVLQKRKVNWTDWWTQQMVSLRKDAFFSF